MTKDPLIEAIIDLIAKETKQDRQKVNMLYNATRSIDRVLEWVQSAITLDRDPVEFYMLMRGKL